MDFLFYEECQVLLNPWVKMNLSGPLKDGLSQIRRITGQQDLGEVMQAKRAHLLMAAKIVNQSEAVGFMDILNSVLAEESE